ncbi:MAG: hypothetical protein ACE5FJ_02210, partial [Gemmatimonadales bacterium]
CASCLMVLKLGHPDLHWFIPIPRPKASDAVRQLAEAEGTLAEVLAERRSNSLYVRPDGMLGHPMASIRLLLRRLATKPFEAARKIFLVGNAERLVVQEASPEAANALLKALEEPPKDTVLILTTSQPGAILSTIRSRLTEFRIPRVSDEAVRAFVESEIIPKSGETSVRELSLLAEGCVGRLVGSVGETVPQAHASERFLDAVAGGAGSWAAAALAQPPWSARSKFTALLDSLTVSLRRRLLESAGNTDRARRMLRSLRAVQDAREAAQGNVNPQLTLAVLARELESARWS